MAMDDPCKPIEDAVLRALPGQSDFMPGQIYHTLARISRDAGIDKEAARFGCRRLRDKGLAVYGRGLWTESGEPAGAGYALTEKGREAVKEMETAP